MKNLIIVGGLMLGLGFAIGWMVKPVPEAVRTELSAKPVESPPRPGTPEVKETAEAKVKGKRAERPLAEEAMPGQKDREQIKAQAEKMQTEMAKQMAQRRREKLIQHIDKLAAALGLSEAQKQVLLDRVDENLKQMADLNMMDPSSAMEMMDVMKELSPKALQDQLEPSLTEEQKVALKDFTEREHQTKVDAAALKSLSKLQGVIEFEEGQRDRVYEILASSADANLRVEEKTPDPSSFYMEGLGMDMDPYDLGLQAVMTEMVGDPTKFQAGGGDQKELAGRLREAFDKKIEEKVDALRPVLNEKQVEQYRAELKSKGMGFYGTMLMGLENTLPGK